MEEVKQTFLLLPNNRTPTVEDWQQMLGDGVRLQLKSGHSAPFGRGIIICTAHMAKGLEFDQVVAPEASEKNHTINMERNLLYVAWPVRTPCIV
ncbi:hypothetical protein HVA01_29560 [Halovibrio variabilis]|uniref:UvrD-like helicase C-terminal domain-containing protein n=1 Tax=Halovibrio variabilis TaxID=31910 RepID=A0A511URT7_9GAMM|nr:ATP-binding domain-containing protein [Halovibrio variabilis]GEN29310.1 hypothetical protein HVA01_29560 [Halovibrio variabilis]